MKTTASARLGKPSKGNKQNAPSPVLKVLLHTVLWGIALLQIFPLVWLINYSFLKSGEFFGKSILKWPEKLEWTNYVNAFTYGSVPKFMLNSFFITMVTILVAAILSVMLSYAFVRMQWKLRKATMALILLGMIVPIHATLLPNFILFDWLHLIDNPLSLILPYIAFSLPISMLIISGFMETIPRSIEESAVMDGCSVFGIIFRIILPITKPAIATVCIMNFISWWNEFIMANTFLTSETFKTLPFSIMKFTGQYSSNYGAQFAVMTLIALPTVITYLLFTEQMSRGITAGAVKG
ncbi:raffinose/stachyose/melibiose transport system permease protein [Paenibacillus castaneae]|uniref:carbohydrate ABC transporter permease n=1 Tax=Paenibacillus castaneae TaxID=474957 RepID=UPI000C9AF993|nr:carbohydrate ABC transporter permease [Paenibacillus castaneae]NIK77851.1 raffinose/stachyose/melibiose transport system permease protein [Paenibacillus castaneae]